jgi:hypothetical protein
MERYTMMVVDEEFGTWGIWDARQGCWRMAGLTELGADLWMRSIQH